MLYQLVCFVIYIYIYIYIYVFFCLTSKPGGVHVLVFHVMLLCFTWWRACASLSYNMIFFTTTRPAAAGGRQTCLCAILSYPMNQVAYTYVYFMLYFVLYVYSSVSFTLNTGGVHVRIFHFMFYCFTGVARM